LWVGLWSTVGYTAGSHLTALYKDISRYEVYLLAAVVVLVAALVIRHRHRHRHRRTHPPAVG
ncbi:MAG: hypothetical protein ACYDAQ_09555, partial [Mycobacteriales bacterium]